MMIRQVSYSIGCAVFLLVGNALALELPNDPRMRVLPYNVNDIYTINTRIGYQTYVEFAPGEEIQTISVGDRSLWQLIPSGNRLFIRPLSEGMSTNMAVITSLHSYQFDLHSLGEDSKEAEPIYVARFAYGNDVPPPPVPLTPSIEEQAIAASVEASAPQAVEGVPAKSVAPFAKASDVAPPAPREIAVELPPLDARHYTYTYSGPAAEVLENVFDDGRSTYIRLPEQAKLPLLYAVKAADGSTVSLPYRLSGRYMIVDAIESQLLLKSGENTVYLYNEARKF